jgi:hypothetical protein
MIVVNDNKGIEIGTGGSIFDYVVPPVPPMYNYTPTVNTMAYWPLNNDGLDKSGNSKNLTFVGDQSFVDNTKFGGKCSFFNGINNVSSVYGIAENIILPNDNFTMSFWVYCPINTNGMYIGTVQNSITWAPYHTWFGYDSGFGGMGGIMGGNTWNWGTGLSPSTGVWFNTIVTYQTDRYYYYLNGNPGTEFIYPTTACGGGVITVGATGMDNGSGYRAGSIYMCEVIVENKYWSATDVSNYYTPRA